jgi:hypothetical protein
LSDEVERAAHITVLTSTVVVITMLMLAFYVVLTPSLSPLASVGDWDGDGTVNVSDEFPRDPAEQSDTDKDGVGDNSDAFPTDKTETADSDGDGVGDVSDFCDGGNGVVSISLDSFDFLGYEGSEYRWRYYPNPWFQVKIDADGDGLYDLTFDSEMFVYVLSLEDFFNVTVDVEDGLGSFGFKVIAYDVWSVSETNVTDYEIMDYSPSDELESVDHQISLPFDGVWESSGAEDGDTPDCALVYSMATTLSG